MTRASLIFNNVPASFKLMLIAVEGLTPTFRPIGAGPADLLCKPRPNFIIRQYSCGPGTPFHIDRPKIFDEKVFGVNLKNISPSLSSLAFSASPGGVGRARWFIAVARTGGIGFSTGGHITMDVVPRCSTVDIWGFSGVRHLALVFTGIHS